MKRYFNKFLFLAGSSFFCFLAFPEPCHALLQVNRILLIEDYDTPSLENRFAGEEDAEETLPGRCVPHSVTGEEAFGRWGASLALDCDGRFPFAVLSFWSRWGRGGFLDLSEMEYLSFWMKGEGEKGGGGLRFFVEVREDTDGDRKFTGSQDTADRVLALPFAGDAAGAGWWKVVIPLYRFQRVTRWDQILEIALVFENPGQHGEGKLLVDRLLFGSNYPDGLRVREISMQNRVSSFKIGNRIAYPEMKLKGKPTSLTLALTFVDPYLEEIRFEESQDGGRSWRQVQSFHDHSKGGVYSSPWRPHPGPTLRHEALLRAIGVSLLGGETALAGPYRLRID